MSNNENSMLMAVAGGFFLATLGPASENRDHSTSGSLIENLRKRLKEAMAEFHHKQELRQARLHLEQLDDRLLQDIGVRRDQIAEAVVHGVVKD